MKIAIISDIHSNCYSLEAFKSSLEQHKADIIFCCGDLFGYYPWAAKTYRILTSIDLPFVYIKGNHDQMILNKSLSAGYKVMASYGPAIDQNTAELKEQEPGAIDLLKQLSFKTFYKTSSYNYTLVHGTPEDIENGRYYPDDQNDYSWFPDYNNFLILGHTHYPLYKNCSTGGTIINPGSIGQPRDGNTNPSWVLWNEETNEFKLLRYSYDISAAIHDLKTMNWDERAIMALQKNKPGKLLV